MARSASDEVLLLRVENNDPDCVCVGATPGRAGKGKRGGGTCFGKKRRRKSLSTADVPIVVDGDETAYQVVDSPTVTEVSETGENTDRSSRASLGGPRGVGTRVKSSGTRTRPIAIVDPNASLEVVEDVEVEDHPLPKKACMVSFHGVTPASASKGGHGECSSSSDDNCLSSLPSSSLSAAQTEPSAAQTDLSASQTDPPSVSSAQPPSPTATSSSLRQSMSGISGTDLDALSLDATSCDGPSSLSSDRVDSDYQLALQLNKVLNESTSVVLTGSEAADAELARSLQEEEYRQAEKGLAITGVEPGKPARSKEGGPSHIQSETHFSGVSSQPAPVCSMASSAPTFPATSEPSTSSLPINQPTAPQQASQIFPLPPTWIQCPNCPPELPRRYHLIPIQPDSEEWEKISVPLNRVDFVVAWAKRIQNEALWQRLQLERQLMLRGRPKWYNVNGRLLYHTSQADRNVICDEGLDQRLSRSGNFGGGIYFSDDPRKCNAYWRGGEPRIMFACRVLLGDTKIYSKGQSDSSLRREPLKEYCVSAGEPKAYDSVMGNVTGYNEYVVYNTYRVLPEYVLEYVWTGNRPGRGRTYQRKTRANNAMSRQAGIQYPFRPARSKRQAWVHAFTSLPQTFPLHTAGPAPAPASSLALPSTAPLPLTTLPTGSAFSAPPPPPPPTVAPAKAPSGVQVNFESCLLCGLGQAVCRCGLTVQGLCDCCSRSPATCSCPVYSSSTGEVLPYRCLTPRLKNFVMTHIK